MPSDRDPDGFTLVELLVTMVVLGVLAAIAIPIYVGQDITARNAAAKSDLQSSRIAMASYLSSHEGDVPSGTADLVDFGYSQSEAVSVIHIDPSSSSRHFCITATTTVTGDHFMVTDAIGVRPGTCADWAP